MNLDVDIVNILTLSMDGKICQNNFSTIFITSIQPLKSTSSWRFFIQGRETCAIQIST
jgi:hypothetical protein